MKKMLTILLAVSLLLGASGIPVSAAENLPMETAVTSEAIPGTFFDLLGKWGSDYPEWLCGFWLEEGQLAVGLMPGEAGERGKAEITEALGESQTARIRFVTQQYPLKRLYEVMDSGLLHDALASLAVPDLYAAGIDNMRNCVYASVNLAEPSPELQALMAQCAETYGDLVIFEQGSPVVAAFSDEPDVWNGGAAGTVPAIAPVETVPPEEPGLGLDIGGEHTDLIPETAPSAADEPAPTAEEEPAPTAGENDPTLDIGGFADTPSAVPETVQLEAASRPEGFLRTAVLLTCGAILLLSAVIFLRRRKAVPVPAENGAHPGSAEIVQMLRAETPELPEALKARVTAQLGLRDRKP